MVVPFRFKARSSSRRKDNGSIVRRGWRAVAVWTPTITCLSQLPDEAQDLAKVVACELFDHLAIVDQEDGRHVAGGIFGARQRVKVADREGGLSLKLIVTKCGGEFLRVTSASPRGSQVDDGLATLCKQRLELCKAKTMEREKARELQMRVASK